MKSDDDREAIERALGSISGGTRRERQQAEIVTLLLRGDLRRARALGAEHLAEFPQDALIRHLLDAPDGSE